MDQHNIDTVIALRRLAAANGHGPLNTEQSHRHLRQLAESLDASPYRCPHDCDFADGFLPLAAQRWGNEYLHEQTCPLHDANSLGVHRDVELRLPSEWGGGDDAA
jgi:hypothetical protein